MRWVVEFAEWVKRRYFKIHHDAVSHPAEAYYASVYLQLIRRHIEKLALGPLDILDAGCGTGRLLVPLAERGNRLTGIDYNRDSLRLASEHCSEAGVKAELIYGQLNKEIQRLQENSYDAILAIEVLYVSREYAEIIRHLYDLLRHGGLLFVTHRTSYYYVLQSLANHNFKDAHTAATNREARLKKGKHRIYYNWQSAAEIHDIYNGLNAEIILQHPIGSYSGFFPDPLAVICNPEELSEDQLNWLRKIEVLHCDLDTAMACRYLLTVARK